MSELGDKLREQAKFFDEHPKFKSVGLAICPTRTWRWAMGATDNTTEGEALGFCVMHLKAMEHDYFWAPRTRPEG